MRPPPNKRIPYLLVVKTPRLDAGNPSPIGEQVDGTMPRGPIKPRVYKVRAERTDMQTGCGSTYLARWKS